jgi:hypothetical protein
VHVSHQCILYACTVFFFAFLPFLIHMMFFTERTMAMNIFLFFFTEVDEYHGSKERTDHPFFRKYHGSIKCKCMHNNEKTSSASYLHFSQQQSVRSYAPAGASPARGQTRRVLHFARQRRPASERWPSLTLAYVYTPLSVCIGHGINRDMHIRPLWC